MRDDLVLDKIAAGIREGSAFIAQDIVSNIEKYGIPPVIAIDGKLKNLRSKVIDLLEIPNLLKILKKFNYNIDDFCFLESKNAKYSSDKTILESGSIICICQKSGNIREYKANQKSFWIDEFVKDLQEKTFK